MASQFHAFTPRILENTVLPSVCKLCDANPAVWPYVFPIFEVVKSRSTIGISFVHVIVVLDIVMMSSRKPLIACFDVFLERIREKTSLCFESGLSLAAPTGLLS